MTETRYYFAGVNRLGPLTDSTKGEDVLVSFADILKTPAVWDWMRPLIEAGHWRSVILDSGAFTELTERKRGRVFKVRIEDYAAFANENAHLFDWIANLDDIEGNVERSNTNLAILEAQPNLADKVVPVYHEGESLDQLAHCVERARAGRGVLAIGCQRPNGKLRPKAVEAFLTDVWPALEEMAGDLVIHGFGLTRYATTDTPSGRAWPFDSVDSTTWIAEACALNRSGATPDRAAAFAATVVSYRASNWIAPQARSLPGGSFDVDLEVAEAFGLQARTVARRLARLAARIVDAIKAATPEIRRGAAFATVVAAVAPTGLDILRRTVS